jgi:hypothetical protein
MRWRLNHLPRYRALVTASLVYIQRASAVIDTAPASPQARALVGLCIYARCLRRPIRTRLLLLALRLGTLFSTTPLSKQRDAVAPRFGWETIARRCRLTLDRFASRRSLRAFPKRLQ